MKKVIALLCIALAACATPMDGKGQWKCEAPNMVLGSYDGGSFAYIHLLGYMQGRNYPVVKQNDTLITGATGNGTPFTCTLQK